MAKYFLRYTRVDAPADETIDVTCERMKTTAFLCSDGCLYGLTLEHVEEDFKYGLFVDLPDSIVPEDCRLDDLHASKKYQDRGWEIMRLAIGQCDKEEKKRLNELLRQEQSASA